LSINTSSEKSQLNLSLSRIDTDGAFKTQHSAKTNVRPRGVNKLTKAVTLGFNANYNSTELGGMKDGQKLQETIFGMPSVVPIYNEDGSYFRGSVFDDGDASKNIENPIARLTTGTDYDRKNQLVGGLDLGIKFSKKFNCKSTINYNFKSAKREKYLTNDTKEGALVNGVASINTGESMDMMHNHVLTYKTGNKDHKLTLLGGF
tara:strand:- start:106 stop:717 length:612 start_codon:yes stop_codon:yes gene_type:complete